MPANAVKYYSGMYIRFLIEAKIVLRGELIKVLLNRLNCIIFTNGLNGSLSILFNIG